MRRTRAGLWKADPRPGAFVVACGFAIALFAALTAAALLYHPFVAFDQRVSATIRSLHTPALDSVFRFVTHLGDFWAVLVATLVFASILLLRRSPAQAALVVIAVGGGAVVGDVLRVVIERMRPGLDVARIPIPDAYSFPSGHALATFLFFGMLSFVVVLEAKHASTRGWVLAVCVVLAGLVAFSRVYLGVHWLGDVVASWVVGSAWLTLCAAVYFAMTSGDHPS